MDCRFNATEDNKMGLYERAAKFEQMVKNAQQKIEWGNPNQQSIPAPDPSLGDQPAPFTPPPAQNAPGVPEKNRPAPLELIPIDVQKKLSDIMVNLRIGIPLSKIDGKVGPETQQALNNYANHFGLKGMTNKQLFAHIKYAPEAEAHAPENKSKYELSDLKQDVSNLGKPFAPR
jgi:hypothetical protein